MMTGDAPAIITTNTIARGASTRACESRRDESTRGRNLSQNHVINNNQKIWNGLNRLRAETMEPPTLNEKPPVRAIATITAPVNPARPATSHAAFLRGAESVPRSLTDQSRTDVT